jgi:hypothetical protein
MVGRVWDQSLGCQNHHLVIWLNMVPSRRYDCMERCQRMKSGNVNLLRNCEKSNTRGRGKTLIFIKFLNVLFLFASLSIGATPQ